MSEHDQQAPEGFTLQGEREAGDDLDPAIYSREAEPDGVGGQDPGFDGSAPDDGDVDDPLEPNVDDDV